MLHETAEPSIEFNRSHVNFKCIDKKLSDIQGVWTNFIDFSHICIDYHVFLNKFNFDRTYWCLYLFIGFHRLSWMRIQLFKPCCAKDFRCSFFSKELVPDAMNHKGSADLVAHCSSSVARHSSLGISNRNSIEFQ